MNTKEGKKNQGQSLVEMIVVVGMVVLLVTGIVSGTTLSLRHTNDIQQRGVAVKYAQEGIELTRGLRDEGWATFAAMGATPASYCVGTDGVFEPTITSCSSANIRDLYTRTITLQIIAAETMSVTSVVSWGDQTVPTNSVSLVTYLTQWR